MSRSILFFASISACTISICGPLAPPQQGVCKSPTNGSVSSLQISDFESYQPQPFLAVGDGGGAWILQGTQGASMIAFNIRALGANPPTCLGEKTTVTDMTGAVLASSNNSISTAADDAGGWTTTEPVLLPGSYGSEGTPVRVQVVAAGQTLNVGLTAISTYQCANIGECNCTTVAGCADECMDDNCVAGCLDGGHPSAQALLLGLYACERAQCASFDGGTSLTPPCTPGDTTCLECVVSATGSGLLACDAGDCGPCAAQYNACRADLYSIQ